MKVCDAFVVGSNPAGHLMTNETTVKIEEYIGLLRESEPMSVDDLYNMIEDAVRCENSYADSVSVRLQKIKLALRNSGISEEYKAWKEQMKKALSALPRELQHVAIELNKVIPKDRLNDALITVLMAFKDGMKETETISMQLNKFVLSNWGQQFDGRVWTRAMNYYNEYLHPKVFESPRISNFRVTDDCISADCRGTGNNIYEVSISLDGELPHAIEDFPVHCECVSYDVHSEYCKHVATLLMCWYSRKF